MSDLAGNRYSDDFTLFKEAASGISSITIVAKTEVISSVSQTDYPFKNCIDSLQIVDFESDSHLKEIQRYSFYYCTKLVKIDLSKCTQLQTIGDYAFAFCFSLENIQLPSAASSIGTYSFSECHSFTTFQFPKSLSSIGNHAFYDCRSLEVVTFESNAVLTKLTSTAFVSCSSLKTIHLSLSNIEFSGICLLNSRAVKEIIRMNQKRIIYSLFLKIYFLAKFLIRSFIVHQIIQKSSHFHKNVPKYFNMLFQRRTSTSIVAINIYCIIIDPAFTSTKI